MSDGIKSWYDDIEHSRSFKIGEKVRDVRHLYHGSSAGPVGEVVGWDDSIGNVFVKWWSTGNTISVFPSSLERLDDVDPPFDFLPLNGLMCSVCGTPQRVSPGGPTCVSGHGGASGIGPSVVHEAQKPFHPEMVQPGPITPMTLAEVQGRIGLARASYETLTATFEIEDCRFGERPFHPLDVCPHGHPMDNPCMDCALIDEEGRDGPVEDDALLADLTHLLLGVAEGLNGNPLPLRRQDFSDLPALVKSVREERDENEGVIRVWRRRCETAEAHLRVLVQAADQLRARWATVPGRTRSPMVQNYDEVRASIPNLPERKT